MAAEPEVKGFNWVVERISIDQDLKKLYSQSGIVDIKKKYGENCMMIQSEKVFKTDVMMNMIKILIHLGDNSIRAIVYQDGQVKTSSIPSFDFLRDYINQTQYILFIFASPKMLEQFEQEIIDDIRKKITVKGSSSIKDKLKIRELPLDD